MEKRGVSRENAWKWFREFIFATKGRKCVQCGKSPPQIIIQPGHVIPKFYGKVYYFNRFDVFPQCSGCNFLHSLDTKPFYDWYINKYGQKRFDRLWGLRHKKIKWVDLEARIKRWKKKVKKDTTGRNVPGATED